MPQPEIEKKLTSDEAVEALTDRSHIHPHVRGYFGDKLVDALLAITEDDEIFELDAMYLQGDLTVEEMEEYLMVLPTYHDLMRRLQEWAHQLVQHITRDLATILKDSVDKKGRAGRIRENRGIARMQKSIFDMIESFANMGYATKRNSLIVHLQNYVSQIVFVEIWYRVVLDPQLQPYRELMEYFLTSADKNVFRSFGHNFPGTIALQFISALRTAYLKNKSFFESFLQRAKSELDLDDNVDLAQEIKADFEHINELSYFRTIQGISRSFGDVTVEIYGDESEGSLRSSRLAYVKISFPGADPEIRLRSSPDLNGKPTVSTHIDHDSFHFIIDRHTGELLLGASMIPLDKQLYGNRGEDFINKDDFLTMKRIIFRILKAYLLQKSEDRTKVFFRPSSSISVQQKQTAAAVMPIIPKESEALSTGTPATVETGERGFEPTYVYQPFHPPSPAATPSMESDQPNIIEDIHLDGAYSEENVIAAISRITRIPPLRSGRAKSRGKGSHVVVQGLNGARYPLPNHSGQDVSLAILKRCLQKLEIPYSAFKKAY